MAAHHESEEVQTEEPQGRASTGDILETTRFIGGQGGYYDSHYGYNNGERLKKIQVWAEDNKIRGIRLLMTDGVAENSFMYGSSVARTKSFEFKSNETITSLSLWGNGIGTRLGWIRFRTSLNNSFDFGMDNKIVTEYAADVGSGICVGWVVRSNLDIDAFGFKFLRTIRSSTIKNITYPNIDIRTFPIIPEILQEYKDTNNQSVPNTWEFKNAKTVTHSSYWSVTAGIVFGATISVTAGIPLIAEVNAEFKWEVSVSGTYGQEKTEEHKLEWSKSGVLPPGKSVHLLAITRTGSVDLPYNGTMELVFSNDSKLTYPMRGQYFGVSYTGVEVVTSDLKSLENVEDA